MPTPTLIEARKSTRRLRIVFDDGEEIAVSFDRLRNHSPAADGKPAAPIVGAQVRAVEAVGNYAIRPVFADGHQNGIYSWELLRSLAEPNDG